MRITSLDLSNHGLKEIKGLDVLPTLRDLACYGTEDDHGALEYLDVTGIKELNNLNVVNNKTSHLIMDNDRLGALSCASNLVTSFDFSHTPNITFLNCADNPVKDLNLKGLPKLDWLDCCCMSITGLDLSGNPLLRELRCHTNNLKELDLSHNPELTLLDCYSTLISSLDVSQNDKLQVLHLWDCPNLSVVYLKAGQVIPDLVIDEHTLVMYK